MATHCQPNSGDLGETLPRALMVRIRSPSAVHAQVEYGEMCMWFAETGKVLSDDEFLIVLEEVKASATTGKLLSSISAE